MSLNYFIKITRWLLWQGKCVLVIFQLGNSLCTVNQWPLSGSKNTTSNSIHKALQLTVLLHQPYFLHFVKMYTFSSKYWGFCRSFTHKTLTSNFLSINHGLFYVCETFSNTLRSNDFNRATCSRRNPSMCDSESAVSRGKEFSLFKY